MSTTRSKRRLAAIFAVTLAVGGVVWTFLLVPSEAVETILDPWFLFWYLFALSFLLLPLLPDENEQ